MSLELVILSLSAAIMFALALVLTQFGLRYLSPLSGASISIPTTAVLFGTTAPLLVDFSKWHGGGAVLFLLAGIVFPVAVTLLTFASNRHLGPTLTGALGNLTPLFAVVAAIVLVGEAPSLTQALAIAIIVFGVFALFRGRPAPTRVWPAVALLLPISAALLRGLVQPLVKLGLVSWPDPFAAATIGYIVSAIVVLVARQLMRDEPKRHDFRGVSWFAAVGACNGGAVMAMYYALALGPVTLVAPLVATYPLAALVLERVLLGEKANAGLAAVVGIVAIVGGAILLVASK